MWRFNNIVAQTSQVSLALVVSDYNNDIRMIVFLSLSIVVFQGIYAMYGGN